MPFNISSHNGLANYKEYVEFYSYKTSQVLNLRKLFSLLDKEPRTEQSAHTTQVLLGEPMSFIGVTYSNLVEVFLTGAEMTQRKLHHQGPAQHGDSSQKLETWRNCTACRCLNRLENILSRCLSWSKLLQDSWSEVGSFESFLCSSACFHWQGKSLVNLIRFRDRFETFWVAFLPEELPFRVKEGRKGSVFQY